MMLTLSLLTLLQLDNLSIRRKKIKAQLMFKILKGNAPSYLKSLFSVRTLEYDVRNNRSKLNIPKPGTNDLKRSVYVTVGHYSGITYPTKYEIFQICRSLKGLQIIVTLIYKILTHSRQCCKSVYFILMSVTLFNFNVNVCNTEDFTVVK